jgi:hypothetical protein
VEGSINVERYIKIFKAMAYFGWHAMSPHWAVRANSRLGFAVNLRLLGWEMWTSLLFAAVWGQMLRYGFGPVRAYRLNVEHRRLVERALRTGNPVPIAPKALMEKIGAGWLQ